MAALTGIEPDSLRIAPRVFWW